MKEPLIVNPYLYLPEQYPIQPDDIVVSRHMNRYYLNSGLLTDEVLNYTARIAFRIAKKEGRWGSISLEQSIRAERKKEMGPNGKRRFVERDPRLVYLTKQNLMVEINGSFWFTHLLIVSAMMLSVPDIKWALHEIKDREEKFYPIRPENINTEKSFSTEPPHVLSETLMVDARIAVRVCQKKGFWGRIRSKDLVAENEEMTGKTDFFVESLVQEGMLKQVGPNAFLPTRKLVLWSFLANPKGNWFSTEEEIRTQSSILAD